MKMDEKFQRNVGNQPNQSVNAKVVVGHRFLAQLQVHNFSLSRVFVWVLQIKSCNKSAYRVWYKGRKKEPWLRIMKIQQDIQIYSAPN